MSPPLEMFELVGKAVADRLALYDAQLKSVIAEFQIELAELKLKIAERMSEVKPGEKGEKGDQGEKGEKGEDGVITQKVAAYHDVWKEDQTYELGDFVTLGGSLWHCNVPPTKSKPGESEDWTLAVKRGRDGKDGKSGKDGAKGEKGDTGHYEGIKE